jgi:hypothetical protein
LTCSTMPASAGCGRRYAVAAVAAGDGVGPAVPSLHASVAGRSPRSSPRWRSSPNGGRPARAGPGRPVAVPPLRHHLADEPHRGRHRVDADQPVGLGPR